MDSCTFEDRSYCSSNRRTSTRLRFAWSSWIRLAAAGLCLALTIAGISRAEEKETARATPQPAPPETFREDQRDHWAFLPIERPALPQVKESAAVRNPIDRFILKSLEDLGFRHAPEASRVELLRRVSFDLTGLPPTAEMAREFLADDSPDAYEKLVDRLLASPAYGVRWAQHWLDLAHYADSNGFELDADRPDAWRYRDWVVDALNADMPYDQFLGLQIAGDEIRPGDTSALIATGFARSGPREVVSGNIAPEEKRQNDMTAVTGTVGSVVLGMTMGCARCHDHKFDPIPTTDFYRLQSFWAGTDMVEDDIATAAEKARVAEANKAIDEKIAPFKKNQAVLEKPYRERILKAKQDGLTPRERTIMSIPKEKRTPEEQILAEGIGTALRVTWEEVAEAVAADPPVQAEREKIKRAIYELERLRPQPPAKAFAIRENKPQPDKTFVYKRGEWKSRGPLVEPRPPGVILAVTDSAGWSVPATSSVQEASAEKPKAGGRRAALVRWLTDPANPLVARVIVNRLWQHHFGRGIVATPSDFGTRGEPPSHPELLDWLASELVAGGWKLKPLHRLMVTSATYRMKSDFRIAGQDRDDPDNETLYRMNRRRMEAEALRDAVLAVSGRLNLKMGGPGVRVPIEDEIKELIFTEAEVVDLWPIDLNPAEFDRRSLYLLRKRNVHYALYAAFDAPDTQSSCPVRSVSTHAPQALVLLNSAFAQDLARALASETASESDTKTRVKALFRRVLVRDPSDREVARIMNFLGEQPDAAAWADYALTLLNSNEFIYVP